MFYNRLRWKIHDLEEERSNLILKTDTLTMSCRVSEEEIKVLRNNIKYLQEELDMAKCDLEMEEVQKASAEEEIERLIGENNRLKHDLEMMQGRWNEIIDRKAHIKSLQNEIEELKSENKELRKKCGCPCNKRINSKKSKI